MLILEHKNKRAGQVRLERENNKIFLNYMIAPEERCQGLASKMLELAMEMKEDFWGDIKVLAYTLTENITSKNRLKKQVLL